MTSIVKIVLLALLTLAGACGGSSSPAPAISVPPPTDLGLDRRPMNATCIAPSMNPNAGSSIALERVFSGLAFAQPIAMLQAPGDASRWFVVERAGRVSVFANDPDVTVDADFVDLSGRVNTSGEGGLLSMAFHPDFANNGRVFLSWTQSGSPLVSVVAGFTAAGGSIDLNSEQEVLRVDQDFSNHNGGQIAFGPDGMLYLALGDGGSGGDPNSRAQDTNNLLGAMLRVDVDAATPYAIPGDNPFAGNAACPANHSSQTACPEIFAWGLRNPWRFSFDRDTGELWLGDVGQGEWEEIDRVELGGNYGWDCREGSNAFNSPAASCSGANDLIDPVYQYSHAIGNSVTGGYVYRGQALPGIVGDYLFADHGSGRIWRLFGAAAPSLSAEEMLDTNHSIASLAEGDDGELYVLDIASSEILRIVDGGSAPAPMPVPALLSATGCVDAQDPHLAASGLIPYAVAAPFWSDNADKDRWLAIPDGTAVDVAVDGDFGLPPGSVLMKHFRLGSRLVETRLFMHHPGGDWAGYSFEWDAAETDASLVTGGKVASVAGQDWIFPSENDCLICHTQAAGFSLGLEAAQLNHDFTYPSTGRTANQLETLDGIALFTSPLTALQPELERVSDAAASLDGRARAYLHSNCANCHRPNGPTSGSLDLRFATALADTGACDTAPQAGDLNLGTGARIIAPGDPDLSVLVARMERRDVDAMPPLASNLVDTEGVTLIREWIQSLSVCQ